MNYALLKVFSEEKNEISVVFLVGRKKKFSLILTGGTRENRTQKTHNDSKKSELMYKKQDLRGKK